MPDAKYVALIHYLPPRAGLSALGRWRERTLVAVIDQPADLTSDQVVRPMDGGGGIPNTQAPNYAAEASPLAGCPPEPPPTSTR